ncbi:uncharacterized protein LOC135265729 [Tribolium castaneum]|uniref:uncharacterized protein LOC135265729 n=1 Tax=Tribolium castaneum TaxID=7070 RepID=UPI0030FEB9D9
MLVQERVVFLLSILSSSVIYCYENFQIDALKGPDNYIIHEDGKSSFKPAVATTHIKHTQIFQTNGNVLELPNLTQRLVNTIKKYALENRVKYCDLLPEVVRRLYQRKEIACGYSAFDPICNNQNEAPVVDYVPLQTPFYFDNKYADVLPPIPETDYSPTFPSFAQPDLNYQPGYYIYKPPPKVFPINRYQDFTSPAKVYKPAKPLWQLPQLNLTKGKYKINPPSFNGKPNEDIVSSSDPILPKLSVPKKWEPYLPQLAHLLNEDRQSKKPQDSGSTTDGEKIPNNKEEPLSDDESQDGPSVPKSNESVHPESEKPKTDERNDIQPPENKNKQGSGVPPLLRGTFGTRKGGNNFFSPRPSQRKRGRTLNYRGYYEKNLAKKQGSLLKSRTISNKFRKKFRGREYDQGFSRQNRPFKYNNEGRTTYTAPIYLNISKPEKGEGEFRVFGRGANAALDNFLKQNKGSVLKSNPYYTVSPEMGLPIGLKMFQYPFNETHIANKSIVISLHPKPSELVKKQDISKINDVKFKIGTDGKVIPQHSFRSNAKKGIGGTTVAKFQPSGKTFIIRNNRLSTCQGQISPETGDCNGQLIPLVRHTVTDNCYINDFPRVADFVCLSTSAGPEPIYMTYYSNRLKCETDASNANFKTFDAFNRDCAKHATRATYKYYTNGPVDENANCTNDNPKVCTFEENLVLKEGSRNVLN